MYNMLDRVLNTPPTLLGNVPVYGFLSTVSHYVVATWIRVRTLFGFASMEAGCFFRKTILEKLF